MIMRTAFAAALAAALALPAAALAEEGSGTVTYVAVSSDSSPLANGGSVQRSHLKGMILADDPSSPLHLSTQDCRGSAVLSAEGTTVVESGFCDAADRDGDTWTLWYLNRGDDHSWQIIGGTGKYAAMAGGGTTSVLAVTRDGRATIRWQGSWQR